MKTNGSASSSDSCTSTTSTMSVTDCHITSDMSSSVTPTPSPRFSVVTPNTPNFKTPHARNSNSSSEMSSFSASTEVSISSNSTRFLSPTSPSPLDTLNSSCANFNPIVTITEPEEQPRDPNLETTSSQPPPSEYSKTPTTDQSKTELIALTQSQHSVASLEVSSTPDLLTDGSRQSSVEMLDWTPGETPPVRVFKPPPFRRVISNLDPILEHEDMGVEKNLRRVISLTALNSTISNTPKPTTSHAREEAVRRVRFYIGASKRRSRRIKMADTIPEPDDQPRELSRSRMSSFKNFFRSSSKRKKRKSVEEAHENLRIDGNVIKRSSSVPTAVKEGASADDTQESAEPEHHVIVSPGENDDLEELDLVEDSLFWKPRDFVFQRSHSTKSRLKPLLEDDDLDTHAIARSYTDANLLSHYPAFLMSPIRADWDASRDQGDRKKGSSASDDNGSQWRGMFSRRSQRAGDHGQVGSKHGRQSKGSHRNSIRRHVVQLLTQRKSKSGYSTPQQRLHRGHSLASVELGSWAARGHRRGSALPPFCSSLSPTEASSRTEILQTISSSIIHLFQRKPLKDNELGVLQEHVRFLINSEAGGLVHEYYKDQLLRKGMIILREKIKNEQGLELLKQLGETWDYFFREILPVLQAILYPLSSSLSKEETVRSLSLLAFRNIVVLKVSVKEALDSVNKDDYPVNIPQMLLVLQSIQDNVFLSENQFLLEKLVARVVCPYLGQRGVYEGSPDPVIKVKLKPIPFNIPNVIVSHNDKYTSKAQYKLDNPTSPSPVVTHRGAFQDLSGLKKLKPVLEHVYDGGRRHSIMS